MGKEVEQVHYITMGHIMLGQIANIKLPKIPLICMLFMV